MPSQAQDTITSQISTTDDDAVLFVLSNDTITAVEYNGHPSSHIDGLQITQTMTWQDIWSEEYLAITAGSLVDARHGQRIRFAARTRHADSCAWDVILKLLPDSGTCIAVLRRAAPEPESSKEAQAYLAAFSQALPGITWTADAEGRLDMISADWATSRGHDRSEALGKGWLSVIHPDHRARIAQAWSASTTSGQPYDVRFQTLFQDGTYRWQLVRAQPIRDDAGTITRWVGINIDIDDERRALEQQRIFEFLAQHTNDCIAIFRVDHSLQFFNAAARRLFEIAGDQLIENISLIDLFTSEDRARVHTELLPELAAAGRWSGDFRFRNFHTHEAVPAHYDMFHIYDDHDHVIGIALIVRDLRERLRYEQGFRMLAAAGAALLDTLDYRAILRNIARVVVARFAPCCVIDEIDEHGNLHRLTLAHADPIRETLLQRTSANLRNLPPGHIVMRTLLEGEPQIQISEQALLDACFFHGESTENLRGQTFDSMISVPIMSIDGKVIAALTAGSSIDELGRRLNRDDLYFLQELAHRATAAIDNSHRYERERHIALTLQEAALPRALRHHYGLHVSAEYRPGRTEATIGGDWYDTLALDDGRFLCIVGDVVGNGLRAAVAMSKLRQAMQTAALINPDPNFIFDAADQILRLHNENMYATALIAIYDPAAHATTFASAGHPSPIIINREKHVRTVACSGMMIGLRMPGAEQSTVTIEHEVADVIVLYTDGITEAQRDAEAGLQQLINALCEDKVLHARNTAEALVSAVLHGQRATDDIAVLTLRIDAVAVAGGLHMAYRDVSLAIDARQVFSRYLTSYATAESDVISAELIFGELLGNVARHAPGPIDISFGWEDGEAILRMIDCGPGYSVEHTRLPAEFSESSRGLFLIDNYSKSFTVHQKHGQTTTCVSLEDIQKAEGHS